jgi:glycosyltransferase involved in cell wall biosynthesis
LKNSAAMRAKVTKSVSENLTIVTACRNREDNLKRAIQSWLLLSPLQIIICDWGSKVPITHEILGAGCNRDKVLIDRHEANDWVLTWAFNEVLSKVKTKFVLKLDCDHVVSPDFIEKNPPTLGCFSRGHWRYADKGQKYINGAFLSCTSLLRSVGYYDERLTTYGWDDSDLYERLYDASLGSSVFAKGTLSHLEQCEAARTSEQNVSKESALAAALGIEKTNFLINRNRILAGMLWPWDSSMYKNRESIRARFSGQAPEEASLIEYATQKAFEIHYEWQNLFDKTGLPAGESYLQVLYLHQKKLSNAPSSISIASLLRRYADSVRAHDEVERGFVRMALLGNSQQTRLKSRLAALASIDKLMQSKE